MPEADQWSDRYNYPILEANWQRFIELADIMGRVESLGGTAGFENAPSQSTRVCPVPRHEGDDPAFH